MRETEKHPSIPTEPWTIPGTWRWMEIGSVCQVVGGGTPSTSVPANFENGTIPWITPADLSGYASKTIARGERNITTRGLDGSGARLMPKGTVLFSSRAPIGYVAVADAEVATNQGFKSFIPPGGISSDFLYYYLHFAKPLAIALSSGTTFKEISGKNAGKIPLPIVPLPEQHRIVAKIEELFSDLDAGVAALKRVKANLKRYRASVLKAAVEGRLTAEWRKQHPDTEPADKLLQRILAERRKKWEEEQLKKFKASGKTPPKDWQKKYQEPAGPDTTNLPELPKGWCWASVDQLSIVVRGASPRPAGDPIFFGGGHTPWITVGSITADDSVYLHAVPDSLTEIGRNASRYIEPDTLLLTNSGATLGVPKITMIGGCINDGSVALLQIDYPLKLYLHYFLKSQTDRLRNINQGAAQPNLNTTIVKAICVPLPPETEQPKVVSEVSRLLSVADAVESQVEQSIQRSSRLRQSILKRAFEGRLVPQDPNNEPAEKLLARIKAGGTSQSPSTTEPQKRRGRPRKQPTE